MQIGNDAHGLGLGDLSPNVQQHFAEDLPALLRDQRPWASNCPIDGDMKQVFFYHLRDGVYNFLASQAKPNRTRLLLQAAEDVIDPRIEAALANETGKRASVTARVANEARSMMHVLKGFVRNNNYLLSVRQQKACNLIINSPTVSESTRECAIELTRATSAKDEIWGRWMLCRLLPYADRCDCYADRCDDRCMPTIDVSQLFAIYSILGMR